MVDWSEVACMSDFFMNGKQQCDIAQFCEPLMEPENTGRGAYRRTRNGRSSRKKTTSRGSTANNSRVHRDLVLFLVAQIDLMSNMCLGRSYNCIYQLEKKFPYHMLCALISQFNLPSAVKRAVCELLRCLWIDRYPHNTVAHLKIDWVMSELTKKQITATGALDTFKLSEHHILRREKEEFYSFPTSDKFFACVDFIINYFNELGGEQVIGKKDENDLTTAVLSMTHNLITFGFFGSESGIKRLLDSVVNALDGRNDTFEANQNTRLSVAYGKRTENSFNVNLLGLSERADSASVGRRFIVDVMKREQIGSLRYMMDSSSMHVMNCKTNILRILESVTRLRANYKLSQLLVVLNDR